MSAWLKTDARVHRAVRRHLVTSCLEESLCEFVLKLCILQWSDIWLTKSLHCCKLIVFSRGDRLCASCIAPIVATCLSAKIEMYWWQAWAVSSEFIPFSFSRKKGSVMCIKGGTADRLNQSFKLNLECECMCVFMPGDASKEGRTAILAACLRAPSQKLRRDHNWPLHQ